MTRRIDKWVNWKKYLVRYFFLYFSFVVILSCAPARYETYQGPDYAIASWYGPDFHGRPTSSGEIFDMNAMTCAHKEYPFGTRLKVTNVSNNETVNCLVNDRGPFVAGRDLDLSYAAAKEVGLIGAGTCRVIIEYVGRDTRYIKEVRYISNAGPFTIQVGSFTELSKARHMKMALEFKYSNVYITEADINGSRFYRWDTMGQGNWLWPKGLWGT